MEGIARACKLRRAGALGSGEAERGSGGICSICRVGSGCRLARQGVTDYRRRCHQGGSSDSGDGGEYGAIMAEISDMLASQKAAVAAMERVLGGVPRTPAGVPFSPTRRLGGFVPLIAV